MKLALLTSDHIRHYWMANKLSSEHDLKIVISEKKGNESQMKGNNTSETSIISGHFKSLKIAETKYFGVKKKFPDSAEVVFVERGGINNANVIRSLIKHNIEGVAVFGCGIIKPEIFKQCSAAIFVNAHQGISPYYRGSGTNFWPFVNNEPGLVGVTMHLIDSGIDTGEIICHGVPAMEPDDGIHDVGCKVIETSGELFCEIFRLIGKMNRIETFSQSSKGKLYLRKDFNANAVIKANENIKNGIIKNYLDGELPLTGKQIIKLI